MDQHFFKVPWAVSGDVNNIPPDVQGDGKVSYSEGWGEDYAKDRGTDPTSKQVQRGDMNAIFLAVTEALQQYQTFGIPEFITAADNGGPYAYAKGAFVRYRQNPVDPWAVWLSIADTNTATPGSDATKWQPAVTIIASDAEVDAGTSNAVLMTPAKTARAVTAANVFTQGGTGSVARTLQAKAEEVVSLGDFDTFLNACNKAFTTGRPVRLPGSTFAVPANTVIPGGVRLRGVRGKTVLNITGSGDLKAGGNRIGLKDIAISGGTFGFNTNGYNKHSIETCDFDAQTNHSVFIDTNRNEVDRCSFTNGSASGIAVSGSAAYLNDITRNDVANCANFGIWVTGGANRNLIQGNKTELNGLELVGVTYDCWGNRVHHNHAQGTGDNGISVTGFRNSVIGNVCNLNANHGIGIYGERNEVIGNTGKNNGQRNVASPGSGNYAGVTLTPAFGGLARKNIVHGNRFDDDQGTPTQYCAVKLEVNSHAQWVTGQSVTNANLYRFNGLNLYRATGPGTTGATAPTHTSGSVSDGGVTWTWIASNVNTLARTYAAWSAAQVIAATDLYRYYGNNLYVASAAGTTGATPPTHVSGAVSDGAVTWTFLEEFPANFDSYDNDLVGNRGNGNIQSSVVVDNTSNKHAIIQPGSIRLPAAGRNLYSEIFNGNGSPEGVVAARPGSTYMRQDVSAQGIAFWTKQSGGNGNTGWLRVMSQDSGTTAQRPNLTPYGTGVRGYCYFDTTIGKPVFWDGAAWQEAAGSTIAAHANAIAILGDSLSDMVSDNTATITQFAANGYLTWARFLSGQRFYFDDTLNFGVSGDKISQAKARVPNVIASGAGRCVVLIGTNDLAVTSVASMIADWRDNIILPLQRAGIQPIVMPVFPRTGLSAASLGVKNQFNDHLRRFAQSQATIPAALRAIVVDADPYFEDYAAATGVPIADRVYDGLHTSMIGAHWTGKALADVINQLYPPAKFQCSPADLYDVTNNPRGILNANPALQGTAGQLVNQSGVTPTGQVATGFKLYRGVGTSSALTFAGAKENPRTDGVLSGERQRVTVNVTGAGASTETYVLQPTTNPSAVIAAGSVVELSCNVEFASAPNNLIGLELQMVEVGPASPKQAVDMVRQATYKMPAVVMKGTLRTPPLTLQAGVTAISSYVRLVFDTSSGAASADVYFSDFQMRPVV